MYCLDFGGGSLASLAGLPHVALVAGRSQPERVRQTVARRSPRRQLAAPGSGALSPPTDSVTSSW